MNGARGSEYWRSLDELAATPEFQDLLEREFPRQAIGWSEDEDPAKGRRNFLKLMGASLALARTDRLHAAAHRAHHAVHSAAGRD